MDAVLRTLNQKRVELQKQLGALESAILILGGKGAVAGKRTAVVRRTVSAAAKLKMSIAAKKRWAARKAKQK